MLDALHFVKGAVAKKDYQPALKHFRISGGRVLGYNGTIALSSPIDIDIETAPQAVPFVKAIERCETTTSLHLTPGGKLGIKSGRFKAFIDCHQDTEILDKVIPEGLFIEHNRNFLHALTALNPFIGTDASRPWATGILLNEYSAFATNNIILAEYWIGTKVPTVNIPEDAVAELIRIGEEPIGVQISDNSITFHFTQKRWMRSQLLSLEWPDIQGLLNHVGTGEPKPIPTGLFDAVELVSPFVAEEGRIFFRGTEIRTSPLDGHGASIEIDVPSEGAFHHKQLLLLKDRAETIDFCGQNKPSPWQGPLLRGVILGMYDE